MDIYIRFQLQIRMHLSDANSLDSKKMAICIRLRLRAISDAANAKIPFHYFRPESEP